MKIAKWESAIINRNTYEFYYTRLKDIALSMFEWKNLPPSVDPRFLELCLFDTGMCVFFKDEILDYLALTTMIGGELDVYRIPIKRTAYASNGYNKPLTRDDSVLIFNNYMHDNSVMQCELYARRLYECDRTIDVNIKAQKTPILIRSTEQQRLPLKNLYMQYDGNEPFIFGDKNLDLSNTFQVINTEAPFVADKVLMVKNQIWNEALTWLGISNVNVIKKERLVAAEAEENMGGVEMQKYTRLNSRKDACKKINAMFGLNLSVEYRSDVIEKVQETPEQEVNINE